MKFNYEKSQKISNIKMNKANFYGSVKKGIIYTAVGLSLINLGSNIENESNMNNINMTKSEGLSEEYHENFYNHFYELEEYSKEEYDEKFINYFKKGKLFITNKNNEIIEVDLYKARLVTIINNDQRITYLVDTSKGNNNLFDGNKFDMTKIDKFSDFKYSNIFYDLLKYLNRNDNVIKLNYEESLELFNSISNWDGKYNNELPGTRVINNERSR